MAAITLSGLAKTYRSRAHPRGLLALDEVSVSVADREFVCLLGPSGCGKTTVLNVLAGLDLDYRGEVRIDGRPLPRNGGHPFRVGYVFQEPRLLPWLTVRRNLDFALASVGVPRTEREVRIETWLRRVGLADFGEAHPHELSGGMQQRASIARAFAVDPELLLMDEPFSGLDELTARGLREQQLALWQETPRTVIFVTHNCFEACFVADRILVLSARPGRVRHEVRVDLPRPRSYDSRDLFELSVAVTRLVTEAPVDGPRVGR
jgi:ABC-type nitrate/sulfonate/bicarbonate transport system ATPase subunit